MRKTTKLLSLVLAALMLVGMCTISAGAKFDDVSVENGALYDAVELLSTLNVAKGTTETTFGPGENVTRQQMAAFIYRLMKAGRSAEGGTNDSGFTDLDDSTFFHMITWASQTGVIKGRNATTFDPKGGITLQDAYVMLVRALGYEDDTVLPYPFGYIDLAEEIGLDENIPSDVTYTSTLNRGNVAILLANAFYADMNKVSVEYKFIPNYYGDDNDGDGKGDEVTWAYAAVETAATVAKDVFGVVEETLVVTETNNYSLNGSARLNDDDVQSVYGRRYDEDGNERGTAREWTLADLRLDGKADDYFLANISLFVKRDATDAKKDVVIASKSNLVKKTVAASDIVIDRSTKTDAKYYDDGVKTETADKVMTGLITFGGIEAYLDNQAAPYIYKSLANVDDVQHDKESVKFIRLANVDNDEGVAKFDYSVTYAGTFDGMADVLKTTAGNDAYDTLNDAFKSRFGVAYNGGLYEAEVYDVDGDDYAEYVFIKNYEFVKMFQKNSKNFAVTTNIAVADKTLVGGTKYEDSIIVGEWNDGDAVLVYMHTDNSGRVEYVEVKEAIAPVEATVTTLKRANGNSWLYTLSTGEKVDLYNGNKFVGYQNSYDPDHVSFSAPFALGRLTKAYIKDEILLFADSIASGKFDSTANYALVLEYDPNATGVNYWDFTTNANATKNSQVVFTATGVSDGGFTVHNYVNVLVDGTVKAVKLADTAYTFVDYLPASKTYTYNYAADGVTKEVHNETITDKAVAETVMTEDFLGKFSTFTVGSDGSYIFRATEFGTAASDLNSTTIEHAVLLTTADGTTAGPDTVLGTADDVVVANATIDHYANNVYTLTGVIGRRVAMQDYSKVILKRIVDDEEVYTLYTAETLGKIDTTNLHNVKLVLVNNTKGTTENIGIMYAEVVGNIGSATARDYRVILSSYTENTNGRNKTYVEVMNVADPALAVETVEASSSISSVAVNTFVEIKEDGIAYDITPAAAYAEYILFKGVFNNTVTFDSNNMLLTPIGADDPATPAINEANFDYVIDTDTQIVYFEKANGTKEVADVSIFTTKDNTWNEEFNDADDGSANASFDLFVVAVDDDISDNANIKIAKTIVVAPTGVLN